MSGFPSLTLLFGVQFQRDIDFIDSALRVYFEWNINTKKPKYIDNHEVISHCFLYFIATFCTVRDIFECNSLFYNLQPTKRNYNSLSNC